MKDGQNGGIGSKTPLTRCKESRGRAVTGTTFVMNESCRRTSASRALGVRLTQINIGQSPTGAANVYRAVCIGLWRTT